MLKDKRWILLHFRSLGKVGLHQSWIGANALYSKFRNDPLSWIWPFTVLMIPVALYGITHLYIDEIIVELAKARIVLSDYYPFFLVRWNNIIQHLLWVLAGIISFLTIYRYHTQREGYTWFSTSLIFNSSRAIIFNLPLSYAFLSVIINWVLFSISLFMMLQDDVKKYTILYPDLMYGLKPAYEALLVLSSTILALSFLSVVVLYRERRQKYSKIYYLGLYGGILLVTLIIFSVIYQFDQRLGNIKENALYEIISTVDLTLGGAVNEASNGQIVNALHFYQIVLQLPGNFPIPPWVTYIFGVRTIVIIFELLVAFSPDVEQKTISKVVKTLLSKLED